MFARSPSETKKCVSTGILVTATKTASNEYSYNTVVVVLLTECVKLVASAVLYLREKSVSALVTEVSASLKVLLLYFVPSFLYCIYNNLAFVNLQHFDPTTYYLLLQFRVVVTGVIFQVRHSPESLDIVFSKQLTRRQWGCLLLLTLGCLVKQLDVSGASSQVSLAALITPSLLLLLVQIRTTSEVYFQVFCSCFAGVYNEYLLKDAGSQVHIMLQNLYMYVDSIACNLGLLVLTGQGISAFSASSLAAVVTKPLVLAIVVNNAACGIITSFFLRTLNSILKSFASALELVFTALLCWIIFGIPVNLFTFAAVAIVSLATVLYSQSPVVNKVRTSSIKDLDLPLISAKS
ncbi:hypothetical protein LAZ67_19001450 [Cordylochernes scorpioides]|uniref:CMP-sialic acid transporter n=1 Tax=Cordylochernes scorpioides TaxID=51811 RepID=A0ABY6LLX6_9ARAC|nr:hypothetical protein LAZ67_19001450 [Cordylochernes scorpioides]